MAITINTRPLEYDTRAIYDASTNQAEDASHVNVRVEAELMVGAVSVAKKVKPKALTGFDFTDICRSLVKWTTPDPLGTPAAFSVLDAGHYLGNKITGWTGSGWNTFSSTTNTINSAIKSSGGVAFAYSNSFAVTKGTIYLLEITGYTQNYCDAYLTEYSGGVGLNVSPIIPAGTTNARIYLQPRSSGNLSVAWFASSGTSFDLNGVFYLTELNACDWWLPYYVKFTEKYEDASGVTQTGANLTDTQLSGFFDFPGIESADFTNYQLLDSTKKFIIGDACENAVGMYVFSGTNYLRSLKTLPYMPAGGGCAYFIPMVHSKYHTITKISRSVYDSAGNLEVSDSTTSYDIWHPIQLLCVNQDVNKYLTTYYFRAKLSITSSPGSVTSSEDLNFIADQRTFPNALTLLWRNSLGGFSSMPFEVCQQKKRKSERTQMKQSNALKSTFYAEDTISVICTKLATGNESRLSFIADIMRSDQVYWQRSETDFVPVNVLTTDMDIKTPDVIVPEIEIEYIP